MIGLLCGPGLNDTYNGPVAPGARPGIARTLTGALGLAPTMKLLEGADAGPVPIALVPLTVHVYFLPLVRPVTVGEAAAPVVLPAAPPLLDVHDTPYEVTVLPWGGAGPNVTDALPFPGATLTIAGAPGSEAATIAADGTDAGLWPTALVARTVHR